MESGKRDNKGKAFNIYNWFFFCHGYRGGPTSSNHLGRYFIRTTHVTDQCS